MASFLSSRVQGVLNLAPSPPTWWHNNASAIAAATTVALAGVLYYNLTPTTLPKEMQSKILAASKVHPPQQSLGTSTTITLKDGRKLGYIEYGHPAGTSIFCLHGTPGSRIDYEFWHSTAVAQNARLISVDRPGIGLSTPQPGRTLLSHANDIEQLADHLELSTYGVVGMSGGGPYALACAYALPATKLKAVSLVCGLGPSDIGYYGMAWPNYFGWTWGMTYAPWMIRWWAARQTFGKLKLSDEKRFEMMMSDLVHTPSPSPKDVDLWLNHSYLLRQHLRSTRESFVHGVGSMTDDGTLMAGKWEFRADDIRKDLPVQLWYGKQDVNVPANHGVVLKQRLSDNATLRIEDETHASLEFQGGAVGGVAGEYEGQVADCEMKFGRGLSMRRSTWRKHGYKILHSADEK